jgi:hypothetical protein
MRQLALLALLLPVTAMAGSKVIRTDAYKKAKGMPNDLGIVLVGDATYVVKNRKSERQAVGAEFCPHLVRYFKSTDTFGLVRCVVVPGGNVGSERALELGKETLEIELPDDGSAFAIERREPAVVLFIQDLEILNTLEKEDLRALEDAGASSFKKPITLFGRFAWWDNQQGALMGYQGFEAATTRVLYDGADPQWDDLAWYLARQLGAGMPFEFTW